jgi:hypothetical protein
VYSWQRLELDCWPILLEEVHGKYEANAVKVSFYNLYACLFLIALIFRFAQMVFFSFSYGFHCERYLLRLLVFQWVKSFLLSKGMHMFLLFIPAVCMFLM